MSDHQEFTPAQLERIESAVNSVLMSTNAPRTTGTVVKDILHNQDLMIARPAPTVSINNSSPIGFVHLPPEIRNKIYRYCLVLGRIWPRLKLHAYDRLSTFEKPQTQMFEVCRQIFAEAAPLYFAENKFILSSGELPWCHHTSALYTRPVSKIALQNLRSLSINFDVRDCQILPDHLRANYDDVQFEDILQRKRNNLASLLGHCELRLLEVSLRNCYCAFCHNRRVCDAMLSLVLNIAASPRVVLTGMIDSSEVSLVRLLADSGGHTISSDGSSIHWHPEFEDEDPNDKLRVAFQVAWD